MAPLPIGSVRSEEEFKEKNQQRETQGATDMPI